MDGTTMNAAVAALASSSKRKAEHKDAKDANESKEESKEKAKETKTLSAMYKRNISGVDQQQNNKQIITAANKRAKPNNENNLSTSQKKAGGDMAKFMRKLTPEEKKRWEEEKRAREEAEALAEALRAKSETLLGVTNVSERAAIYYQICKKKWYNSHGPESVKDLVSVKDRVPTHLMMDGGVLLRGINGSPGDQKTGGKLYIYTKDEINLLYETLAADLKAKRPFFMIEKASVVFCMCMDMDYKGSEGVPFEEIVEHARILQREAKLFYPGIKWLPGSDRPLPDDPTGEKSYNRPLLAKPRAPNHPKFGVVICGVEPEVIPERIHTSVFPTVPGPLAFSPSFVNSSSFVPTQTPENNQNETSSSSSSSKTKTEPLAGPLGPLGPPFGPLGASKDPPKPKVKSAAHFIFPNLYVTQEQALYIRQSFVSALEARYGPRNPLRGENEWEDVADEQVLAGNSSLRMVGSHKAEFCRVCKGSGTDGKREDLVDVPLACKKCNGAGRVDIGRAYSLQAVLREDGAYDPVMLEKVNEDMRAPKPTGLLYVVTTIRTFLDRASEGFEPYMGAPRFNTPEAVAETEGSNELELYRKAKEKYTLNRINGLAEDGKYHASQISKLANKTHFKVRNVDEEECLRVLTKQIRTEFNQVYAELLIKNIILTQSKSKRNVAYVNVHGKGSSTCLNIGRDHNNATIYFEVDLDAGTIRQKCHCRSPVLKTGCTLLCRDYSSQKMYVDRNIIKAFAEQLGRIIPMTSFSSCSSSLPFQNNNTNVSFTTSALVRPPSLPITDFSAPLRISSSFSFSNNNNAPISGSGGTAGPGGSGQNDENNNSTKKNFKIPPGFVLPSKPSFSTLQQPLYSSLSFVSSLGPLPPKTTKPPSDQQTPASVTTKSGSPVENLKRTRTLDDHEDHEGHRPRDFIVPEPIQKPILATQKPIVAKIHQEKGGDGDDDDDDDEEGFYMFKPPQ